MFMQLHLNLKPQMSSLINLSSLTHFLCIFFFVTSDNNGGRRLMIEATHIFIYGGCSQESYPPNSPYETNLNSILSSIIASSSQTLYNAFALGNDSTAATAAAYGLYQCRGDLKPSDCSTCVASLINQVGLLCPYTYGASLQHDACFLRYEHADFLGRPDGSLRFKKCSSGGGGGGSDFEFLRRRDDVLADLQGAAGLGFRVSAAGAVEGYAQCLGDLAAADCGACISDAVAKVRSLCGSAAAGDVFLAQCYVRYWESGYSDSSSSDSSNDGDVGKTVAIIVGAVAGVAVLIVFLSFCRKALG